MIGEIVAPQQGKDAVQNMKKQSANAGLFAKSVAGARAAPSKTNASATLSVKNTGVQSVGAVTSEGFARNIRRIKGMTLVEMLLTLSILGVVMGFAIPSFNDLIFRSGVTRLHNELMGMLTVGRQTAFVKRYPLLLCTPLSSGQCSADWKGQLVLFMDKNHNGVLDADDEVIHRSGQLPEPVFIRWKSFRNKPYIEWNQLGQTNASNGTLTLCTGNDHALSRQIVINRTGRARVAAQRGATADILAVCEKG